MVGKIEMIELIQIAKEPKEIIMGIKGELVKFNKDVEEKRECVICRKKEGLICGECLKITKDFDILREWMNGLNVVDENLVYIISFCINDRLSDIINNVNIGMFGDITVIEYAGKPKLVKTVKRKLGEIRALYQAKAKVIELLNGR